MIERLIPCAGCGRHVKASDAACPFCKASMSGVVAPSTTPYRRMAAAAAVAAAALSACSTSSATPLYGASGFDDDAAPTDDASAFTDASGVVFYGIASFDATVVTETKDAGDAGDDAQSVVAFYGAPAMTIDAAPDGASDAAPTDASTDAADSG